MARTERRRFIWDEDWTPHLDTSARDSKTQCWCCSKWKRPARRKERHDGKAKLRRAPEDV